jgi:hypothetical protein
MSVIISNLPSYSGTDADLRFFVMNNSGETETFKYSGYTSPFYIKNNTTLVNYQLGSSADTSINYAIAIGSSTLESLDPVGVPTPGATNVVAVGTNVKTLGSDSVVIGNNVTGGSKSVIIGNNIQSIRNYNLGPNIIVGSDITNLNDVYRGDCYIFGYNFEPTSDGNSISIGRGQGPGNPTQRSAIHIGLEGRAAGDSSINIGKGIVSGAASINIQGYAAGSVNTSDRSTIINGGLVVAQTLNSTGANHQLLNGEGNTISGSGSFNDIINGEGNTISGTSSYSSIYNGSGNTISSKNNVVMLGTSNRTALYDNTTHVENSHNFKTESFGVTNVGSVGGSINVDCSLGTLFYFTITANTTPNFINWKEGQRIQFYVDNSGSFTVPTATITGGGSVYAKSGSLNPTNNEITSYYGTIVNGNMFLDEHLNFQPV